MKRKFAILSRATWIAVVAVVATLPTLASAAPITLTTMFNDYTQQFDSLANTGTDNTLPPGWEINTGTYLADDGSDTVGGIYSYGNITPVPQVDRALGSLEGDVGPLIFGASFTNGTTSTIERLDIQYIGEHWRRGGLGVDALKFEYSVDAAATLTTGTYLPFATLDYTKNSLVSSVTRLNGNLTPNRVLIGDQITGLSIAPGSTFWIRFSDVDSTLEHGLAVDNFQLTPLPANADIPEPSSGILLAMGALGCIVIAGYRRRTA